MRWGVHTLMMALHAAAMMVVMVTIKAGRRVPLMEPTRVKCMLRNESNEVIKGLKGVRM